MHNNETDDGHSSIPERPSILAFASEGNLNDYCSKADSPHFQDQLGGGFKKIIK